MNLHARIVLGVAAACAMALSGCARKNVDLTNRPCDNSRCLTGFVCRWDNICVPEIRIGCVGDGDYCPHSIATGDYCTPVGAFIPGVDAPSEDTLTNCDMGCRVCQANNTWSDVVYCKLGQINTCSTCSDDCMANTKLTPDSEVVTATATCEPVEGGYQCRYACVPGYDNRLDDYTIAGCPDLIVDEMCDKIDNDIDGLTDEEGALGCVERNREVTQTDGSVVTEKKCLCEDTLPYTPCTVPSTFTGLVFQVPVSVNNAGQPVYALARVEKDGTGYKQIAVGIDADVSIEDFALSPDRKWVSFITGFQTGAPSSLYVASLIDCNPLREVSRAIPSGGKVFTAKWAPDSKHIAYTAAAIGSCCTELYVVEPNGVNERRIDIPSSSNPNLHVFGYEWAPDSTSVAYISDHDVYQERHTYVATIGVGSEPMRLSCATTAQPSSSMPMAWSPNSQHLAFWQSSDDINYHLLVARPKTASACESSSLITLHDDTVLGKTLALSWQPQSLYLAIVGIGGGESTEINTYYVVGGEVKRIDCAGDTAGKTSDSPAWSASGTLLAYISDSTSATDARELYVSSPNGSGACTPVSGTLSVGNQVRQFDWRPDSDSVVFTVEAASENRGALYSLAIGQSSPSLVSEGVCLPTTGEKCKSYKMFGTTVRMAYVADTVEHGLQVFVTPAGNTATPGARLPGQDNLGVINFAPSRDGERMALVAKTNTGERWSLHVVELGGGNITETAYPTDALSIIGPNYAASYSW